MDATRDLQRWRPCAVSVRFLRERPKILLEEAEEWARFKQRKSPRSIALRFNSKLESKAAFPLRS
jgi:hypothetical protein